MNLLSFSRSDRQRRRCAAGRAGFSITELLVVIGVIVLLASLLLVAMGRVRTTAMQSRTLSTMQAFAAACDSFQTEHGQYPGVIPERVLAQHDAQVQGGGTITFTSTENALLHLMGGYRVWQGPPDTSNPSYNDFDDYDADYELSWGSGAQLWQLKIKLSDIGQGPVINGRPFPAYYTPSGTDIGVVAGQFGADIDDVRIPDLIDAWGQPILYIRQVRSSGPLVGEPGDRPQFVFGTGDYRRFGGMTGYLNSEALGEQQQDQVELSLLNDPSADRLATFAQIIRHPSFGDPENPLAENNWRNTAARGQYVLISAGKDGVFFSKHDGPGRPGDPVTNIVSGQHAHPRVIDEYDDILFFGGG